VAHKAALLDELKLVDDILSERQTKDNPATEVAEQSDFVRKNELNTSHDTADADYKARQRDIDEELGDEINFVKSLISNIGGSPSHVAYVLKTCNYAVRILKGQSRYENGQWDGR
jgi:hypothetical protein